MANSTAADTTIGLFIEASIMLKSRMQKAISLPFSQGQALWFIAENKNPNMQQLARQFMITAPSATALVEELVRSGFVNRKSDSRDRRKIALALTPKGKKAYKALALKRKTVLSDVFGSLSANDREELNRILNTIIKSN